MLCSGLCLQNLVSQILIVTPDLKTEAASCPHKFLQFCIEPAYCPNIKGSKNMYSHLQTFTINTEENGYLLQLHKNLTYVDISSRFLISHHPSSKSIAHAAAFLSSSRSDSGSYHLESSVIPIKHPCSFCN
jgi:hypothetical protein